MFRFDHDASQKGVGGGRERSRAPIHRSVISSEWTRRGTGDLLVCPWADGRPGFGLGRKNQMSD